MAPLLCARELFRTGSGEGIKFTHWTIWQPSSTSPAKIWQPGIGLAKPKGGQGTVLSPAARQDIRDILLWSLHKFGIDAAARYLRCSVLHWHTPSNSEYNLTTIARKPIYLFLYGTLTYTGDDPMALPLRTQRTEARLLPDQKKRIERAANIKGVSLSDFIVQNADEAAIRTIQQHESWTLETKDRNLFVKALLSPPGPGARLKSAAKRYTQRVRA